MDKQREEFEAWVVLQHKPGSAQLGKDNDGDYINVYTIHQWKAWQAAQAAQPAQPTDWRELCRRLYVELFHVDQQLCSVMDENDEPVYTQGSTVRDALKDASAALAQPAHAHAIDTSPERVEKQAGNVQVPVDNRCIRELLEYCRSNEGAYIFPRWDGNRVLKYLTAMSAAAPSTKEQTE